jgi:hypothetical protein
VLKNYILATLNNIVVGHSAVGDCNRKGKLRSARGSNGSMEGTEKTS